MKNDEINEKVKSLISKILNLEKLSDDASTKYRAMGLLAYLSIVAKLKELKLKSVKNFENLEVKK